MLRARTPRFTWQAPDEAGPASRIAAWPQSSKRITPAARIAATSRCRCSGRRSAASVGSKWTRRVAIGISHADDAHDGILLHDFWAAYEAIDVADRQYCLVHLLRELEQVDEHNSSAPWQAFAKTLRRLIRDGIRLRKRPDFTPQRYRGRILRLGRRLDARMRRAVSGPGARYGQGVGPPRPSGPTAG
jgi:hypothetical protein